MGLWCALHGDSFFQGGLHHLAILTDFERFTQHLSSNDVSMMHPFSTFSYLTQSFTVGEQWALTQDRIAELKSAGLISVESAEKFMREGAVGSHVENIQRQDGYKGFSENQVSTIIKETDPETYRFD